MSGWIAVHRQDVYPAVTKQYDGGRRDASDSALSSGVFLQQRHLPVVP